MSKKDPEFLGGSGGLIKFPLNIHLPAKVKVVLVALLIALVLLVLVFNMCFVYVHPDEWGIKQVNIGMDRGYEKDPYGTGLAFVMPFGFEYMHRLPKHVQVLHFNRDRSKFEFVSGVTVEARSVKIQTSDGSSVDVDVTIAYRITDPYVVATKLGPGEEYLRRVIARAEPNLKSALGRLTQQQFYDSPLRAERANEARDQFNEEMKEYGIEIEHVLVRYFEYDPTFQDLIEQNKLQVQMVLKQVALGRKEDKQMALERVRTEGEQLVHIEIQGGQAYRVEREAERDFYVRSKMAEADLLMQLAEAEAMKMRNEAMQVIGADRKVAMEMAKVLEGLEVILMPSGGAGSMNPLDLDDVLDTFGVQSYVQENAAKAPARLPADRPGALSFPNNGGTNEEVAR